MQRQVTAFLAIVFTAVSVSIPCFGQNTGVLGKILGVTDNSVSVLFGQVQLSVGEEVRFVRHQEIVDPVSGKVRGGRDTEIATGIVDDLGIDRATVTIVSKSPGITAVLATDRVYATGKGKKVTRSRQVVGTVQTLSDDGTMELDVGSDDEISEGDMFLIRRTESVVDPATREVVETRQIEVGRGRVDTVTPATSRATVVEFLPGMQPGERDEVVFEPEQPVITAQTTAPVVSSVPVPEGEIERLNGEIEGLHREMDALRSELDVLRRDQGTHQQVFEEFRTDIDKVASGLMTDDMQGNRILIKGAGTLPWNIPAELAAEYRDALDACLAHRFGTAVPAFRSIIDRYPDSPLVENCRYWIAQSSYTGGNLEAAADQFRTVLDDKRFTHKDDDASIMLGITCYRLGRMPDALSEFRTFLKRYPDSEYRNKVENWVKRLS
jgi:TolA-binding protein